MDIAEILSDLDNNSYKTLLSLTTAKANKIKLRALMSLGLERSVILDYIKQLREYIYVDAVHDIKPGNYIRLISLLDPHNIVLHRSTIVCECMITDTSTVVTCKNFSMRSFKIKLEDYLVFQKLTLEETIILDALDKVDSMGGVVDELSDDEA